MGSGLVVAQGRLLYERNCVACHGRRGEGEGSLFFPRLTGQHAKYVRRSLLEIKEGTRRNANASMQKLLQDLSDKDLDALADYVSQLKREPDEQTGRADPVKVSSPGAKPQRPSESVFTAASSARSSSR
jgi:cytochrome c553